MVRKGVRILVVLGVLAAVVLGAALPIKHKKQALAAAPKYGMQPTPVRVALARRGDLRKARDYLAVVEPIRVADVSARLTATVEKVLHDENEPVKAGDVLVVLDGRQIEDSIATAGAQVEEAQADLASNQATVASLEKIECLLAAGGRAGQGPRRQGRGRWPRTRRPRRTRPTRRRASWTRQGRSPPPSSGRSSP